MLNFEAAAAAAERAANARNADEERDAVYSILKHKEEIQIATTNMAVNRLSGPLPGSDRLPLMEDGHEFGRVVARVPKALYFGLMHQKNFGHDGFCSDEGIKDLHKAFPCTRVNTVSGKIVSGYGTKSAPRRRVNFGRGTMQFAT